MGDGLKIVIQKQSSAPIYEQIKEQIRNAIYGGELSEDDALPSIRQLARDLQVSVITTTRAYNDLEQEGLVSSVHGKGFFVLAQDSKKIRKIATQDMEHYLVLAVDAAKKAQLPVSEIESALWRIVKEEEYE